MTEMFPTKSRLQVAIAIEKLCYAERDAIDGLMKSYIEANQAKGLYFNALQLAINERIRALARAILFQPARRFYNPRQPDTLIARVRGRSREFRL